MGRLILRLFGTPEVSHAEQPLTFQTRKVLALLAYLAVEQGVHSCDKITALLWPESDEERRSMSRWMRRRSGWKRATMTSAERTMATLLSWLMRPRRSACSPMTRPT